MYFFQTDEHVYNTPDLCRDCIKTFTSVKNFSKRLGLCQKNEPCFMIFPEKKPLELKLYSESSIAFQSFFVMLSVDTNMEIKTKRKYGYSIPPTNSHIEFLYKFRFRKHSSSWLPSLFCRRL